VRSFTIKFAKSETCTRADKSQTMEAGKQKRDNDIVLREVAVTNFNWHLEKKCTRSALFLGQLGMALPDGDR